MLDQINSILWEFIKTAALLILSIFMVGFIVVLCDFAIQAALK